MCLFRMTYELQPFYFGYVIYAPLAKMQGVGEEVKHHICIVFVFIAEVRIFIFRLLRPIFVQIKIAAKLKGLFELHPQL